MAASLEQNRAEGNVNDGYSGFFGFVWQGSDPQITRISQIFHSLIESNVRLIKAVKRFARSAFK
jgi:hypothetical protein